MTKAKIAAALVFISALVFSAGGSSADTFTVRLVSQTTSTITLGWDPQPGYGYLFSGNGALLSRTNDPNRSTVKFSKQYTSFEVAVIVKGATGIYPVAPPPPPKPQCSDGLDNDGDSKIDYPSDPGCLDQADNSETDPPPPPPPGAQAYISPSGNDAAACTQAAPCRTFTRGTRAVGSAGGTVSAAAGTYGSETIQGAGNTGPIIIEAAGATAGNIDIQGATNLEIRGLHAQLFYVGENSASEAGKTRNITLRNVDTVYFFGRSVDGLKTIDSRIGGSQDGTSATVGAAYQSAVYSKNVVFDNVTFHDIGRADNPSGHVECFYAAEIDGLTIRNSEFTGCGIFDIMFDTIVIGDGTAKNVTITGTKFDKTIPPTYGLYFKTNPPTPFVNYLIENNWFIEGTGFSSPYASSLFQNFVARGNYGNWSSAQQLAGVTFTNNHFGQSPPAGWPG